MRRFGFIALVVLVLVGVAFAGFWDELYEKIAGNLDQKGSSVLRVKSLKGDYEVYVDNEKKGDVLDGEEEEFFKIEPGERNVKLVRKSSVPDFYFILERNLTFMSASTVVVEWESGPTLESSSGIIKYYTEIYKPDGAYVYVLPFPQNATVTMDSNTSTNNTFEIKDTENHSVSVTNGEGFQEKNDIVINLADPVADSVISNVKLIVEVYLYKYPFV